MNFFLRCLNCQLQISRGHISSMLTFSDPIGSSNSRSSSYWLKLFYIFALQHCAPVPGLLQLPGAWPHPMLQLPRPPLQPGLPDTPTSCRGVQVGISLMGKLTGRDQTVNVVTESGRTSSSLLTNLSLFDDLLLCSSPLNFSMLSYVSS